MGIIAIIVIYVLLLIVNVGVGAYAFIDLIKKGGNYNNYIDEKDIRRNPLHIFAIGYGIISVTILVTTIVSYFV